MKSINTALNLTSIKLPQVRLIKLYLTLSLELTFTPCTLVNYTVLNVSPYKVKRPHLSTQNTLMVMLILRYYLNCTFGQEWSAYHSQFHFVPTHFHTSSVVLFLLCAEVCVCMYSSCHTGGRGGGS